MDDDDRIANSDEEEIFPKLFTDNVLDAAKLGFLKEVIYYLKKDSLDLLIPRRVAGPHCNPLITAISYRQMVVIHYLWTETTARYAKKFNLFNPLKWIYSNKPNDLYNLQKKLQTDADKHYVSIAKRSLVGHMILIGGLNADLKLIKYSLANGCPINYCTKQKTTALLHASKSGHLEIVDFLVKKGADVNCRDREGRTSLSYAVEKEYSNIVQILTDAGANANLEDGKERTPLFYAIEKENFGIVKILIDGGADVNFQGPLGKSPLCYSLSESRSLEIVKILVVSGADVNHFDKLLRTPFHWAASVGNIEKAKILLENNALVYINGYPKEYSDASKALQDYKHYRDLYFSNTPDL